MKRHRARHALAQFDPRHSLPFWSKYDQRINMPWWLAAIGYPIVIGARLVVWSGVLPAAALRTYLSWRPPTTGDIVDAVGNSPFILVLRTFGHDGELLLTPREADEGGLVPQAGTLEQLVGELGERLNMATVGFADHAIAKIPDGIRYVQVEDARWRKQFEELVDLAAVVVAMPTPGAMIGESFESELEYIVRSGKTSRTVVVGPPDSDRETRQATYATYRLLGWPKVKHVYIVTYEDDDGVVTAIPSLGRYDQYLAERYREALDKALSAVLNRTSDHPHHR